MLTKRGAWFVTAAAIVGWFSLGVPVGHAQETTAEQPPTVGEVLPGEVGVAADLKVERDGLLTVTETVTVPDGESATREISLRHPVGDDLDRVFDVTGATVDNSGVIEQDDNKVTIQFVGGVSTLTYTVHGVVADVDGGQEARWTVAGGWDVDLDSVTATFIAPNPSSSVTCFAGSVGSSTQCTIAEITHTQITAARQLGLAAGDRMDLVVGLPPDTAPANVELAETFSLVEAFQLTPGIGLGIGGLLVLLLGGLALVWRARGRDAAALTGADAGAVDPASYQPLVRDGERARFASPDGVLPGQIGTVIDEHVDVVDVTATVVDLAVRNYLWLAEESDADGTSDWRIVRRNPADDALHPYERAVYDALLGDADEVLVRQLRERVAGALPGIRDELYADVVRNGWFQRRPDADRSLASRLGIAVMVGGAVLTGLLAAFTTVALLGLSVVVAGVALWLGARYLPARTAHGSGLLGQLIVLRGYLHSVEATSLPDADREPVFSRSLPYAVVLGETDHWLATFADLDPGADGTPGLYWYGGQDDDADLRQFTHRFPAFLAALDGALAEAGHLRALAPVGP